MSEQTTHIGDIEDAWEWRNRAEAAIRCCETGHRPAYKRGRLVGAEDSRRYRRLAYERGRRHGAGTALLAVSLLAVVAAWLAWRRAP